MNFYFSMPILFSFYLSWVLFCSLASPNSVNLPLKAPSLGNWLVTEGWMEPNMFYGIKNNDLLDGTQVQLISTKLKKYLTAENGSETILMANHNSSSASSWQTFRLWRINETFYNFRLSNKQFIGLENQGNKLVAVSATEKFPEPFQITRKNGEPHRVRFRASNGYFLQAKSEMQVTADYKGPSTWEENDPSVFNMTIVSTMHGEYQITNGYGPDKAAKFMRDHWKSYITEEDFKFMSQNGLNAVRIPVGWWIAYDPKPPKPFVGGSLQALDNAFRWAQKYGMKVIVDLHALRVSQNGSPHSGSRDGFQEWSDSDIQETVAIIDFLASRYADHPSLVAIELMNEPKAPDLKLDSLKRYYKAGYDTVRKYSSSAYVILSNRLGGEWSELLSFASNLSRVVIDVHFYNLFWDNFNKMSVQQNIDYIYRQRSSDLRNVTTPDGPLSFVGEWCCEWEAEGASKRDYQRFAEAQLDVYGRATFGWAYWAYKCHLNHWSLRWMIENNYIKL
ncbi:Mannan endo-1,4-beta-mannosidase [Citrus sinensis]|uniref:probable glucan 1,3-beta-glucosidase A n=1 Tax=Citrus sinensis TaxID=2711 RepID=UPI000D62876B|nr:probable glucan 1,3-beta-glucosidase A [Citrus sinensis]XP_052299906.1 probable glucan 1,3-beta-glucosidase A [Citrus sinensis]KAH9669978.1 Mannan endo-1,4-beta-mannosidase [Citrus sinensis]